MPKINIENSILLGITGFREKDWKDKLDDINKLGIAKAALFLERFDQSQRKKIYRALLDTKLKSIPLCHIRNDMEVEELVFLETKFKTKYFTIHENSFSFLGKWPGFEKKLYLEMNYNNAVSRKVIVGKIGGFCIDFSHFRVAQEKQTNDFKYVYHEKNRANFFCNHLNGYDAKKNSDIHLVKNLKEFDYLKILPKFLFGKIIALETENNISQQMKFKKYLVILLEKIFRK